MRKKLIPLLAIFFLTGCGTITPTVVPETPAPTATQPPTIAPAATSELSAYAFPASIDPSQKYLFYLHGKIVEDQGLHAVSPDYGEYEYQAILGKLASYGFVVISEQRLKNTDAAKYAAKIVDQVNLLLKANVPPENITVLGASKGAAIAALVSNLLKNSNVNFVLLGTCHPTTVAEWKQNNIYFYGNVLAIRDVADDEYSGSCEEMFALSPGVGRHEEIILQISTGHGILYKPLDEWAVPAVEWAR